MIDRPCREVLAYVFEDFPFPLALTYSRLQDELDLQEPVAAAVISTVVLQ